MTQLERTTSLEQFLRLPEVKPPREYVHGKVVHKVSPKAKHSVLQRCLVRAIERAAESKRWGIPFPEIRCTFAGRSLVFDIAYFRWSRIPFEESGEFADDLLLAPDWVIEILSPGQTVRNLARRLAWCVQHGVRLGWLVVPSRKQVLAFRPDSGPTTHQRSDRLDAKGILPGFRYRVQDVFDWLRPAGENG